MNKENGGEQSTSFGIHDHERPAPRNDAVEKLNEIPGRQLDAEANSIVDIKSAVHSNYAGMIAMISADNHVCLGKSDNYDNNGHYDNHDKSLFMVSDNTDIYYFLYGQGWVHNQEDMLLHGLSMDQYMEFARLQDGILQQFEQRRQILFDGQPFQPPENYLRTAELTMEGGANNYNMIDGRINNQMAPRADLTDSQTHDEIMELAPETIHRPSVLEQQDKYAANDGDAKYHATHERGI